MYHHTPRTLTPCLLLHDFFVYVFWCCVFVVPRRESITDCTCAELHLFCSSIPCERAVGASEWEAQQQRGSSTVCNSMYRCGCWGGEIHLLCLTELNFPADTARSCSDLLAKETLPPEPGSNTLLWHFFCNILCYKPHTLPVSDRCPQGTVPGSGQEGSWHSKVIDPTLLLLPRNHRVVGCSS